MMQLMLRIDLSLSSRTEPNISASGKGKIDMDAGFRSGRTVRAMRETGALIRPMALVLSGTCMVTSMRVSGSMTKPTAMARTLMQMEQNIKATGRMIFSMGLG